MTENQQACSFIFIYGPPGSGKTTIGTALAAALKLDFLDLDAYLEEKTGMSIAEYFQSNGEAAFRELESEALAEVCGRENRQMVLSLGGGTLLQPENRRQVEALGQVICLMASEETLAANLALQEGVRPLLNGDLQERLHLLLKARQSHYDSFPQLTVNGSSVLQVVEKLQNKLGRFLISGMGAGTDVIVKSGILSSVGNCLLAHGLKGPVALVSDEHVAPLYAQKVLDSLTAAGYTASLIVIPAGEAHKTLESVSRLWQEFLAAGLERGSTVVALGGGVLSDLAGFAAATYLRGIPWVVCPTSLLSMADASLGGKTGADLPQGKNLIGAFHAPALVLTDPDCLLTLPQVELINGLGEVVKHGIISEAQLYHRCQSHDWQLDLEGLVRQAVQVKIRVINEDPYEKGRRAVLNLGHTIGHALELVSDFQLRHGEAVAIGLVVETQIAVQLGLAQPELPEDICGTLINLGLPVNIPAGMDLGRVLQVMKRDKKKSAGDVKFALPEKIGAVQYGISVDAHLVEKILIGLQKDSSAD